MGNIEKVTFNGVVFRRYPDSPHPADRRYFKPLPADRMRGVQALHQEVWKWANGIPVIPEGYHVHHKDHDAGNNDPSNLELVAYDDHGRHHFDTPEAQARWAEYQHLGREAAKAWHASEEGRAWHSDNARAMWKAAGTRELVCAQCGEGFTTRDITKVLYCSNKCKAKARRDSGVDDETRICLGCGAEFIINRYSKAKTCSRKCAWVVRKQG